jgi:anti-sigma regulatory factor (Ser/Thr protein kinase)
LAQVELAERHTTEPGARETLHSIREGLERLRGVVGDLRAFSRGDADSVRAVDVREVLWRVVRMGEKSLLAKARLVEELEPIPHVIGNEGRLSQVFLNLLVNAVEALPEERPKSENLVRVRARVGGDGRVEIAIGDNGVGLDPALADRVFDSFFTTKGARSGTGLGLAISRRIVTEYGGSVSIITSSRAVVAAARRERTAARRQHSRVAIRVSHAPGRPSPRKLARPHRLPKPGCQPGSARPSMRANPIRTASRPVRQRRSRPGGMRRGSRSRRLRPRRRPRRPRKTRGRERPSFNSRRTMTSGRRPCSRRPPS